MTDDSSQGETPGHEPPRLARLRTFDKAFYDDAPAMLRAVREIGPVVRDEAAKVWLVSGYDAARAVVNDRALWRGPDKGEPSAGRDKILRDAYSRDPVTGQPRNYSITQMDDPDHSRVRAALSQPLYARAARARPQIEAIVDEVLDGLADEREFELISRFATPIPIRAIAGILGVDEDRWEQFREWSEGLAGFINSARSPTQEASFQAARAALVPFFADLMRERRRAPKDDLVSDYVTQQDAGLEVSDAEILTNLITFLTAGNLTTTDVIGNGVHLLLSNPSELEKLRNDPGIVNRVVEEVLRLAPPLDLTVRIASRDLELGGCPIHNTQNLTLLLRAANRDPAQFADPDRFDVLRPPRPHLAFGGGAHLCLGAPLARIEVQVAFSKLFARFPGLRLANPDEMPPRRMMPFVNGFEHYLVQT